MHHPTRQILSGLLALGTLALTVHAQTPAAGDPFVKDAAAANARKAEPWQNVLAVLETYAVDKNDAAALLETEPGSGARYRRVLDLAKAGKARLDGLTALGGKSGQRTVITSVDDVRYPKSYSAPNPSTGVAVPTTWEARPAGDTLEYEPVVGPDRRTCDVNIVPQQVRFLGLQDIPGMDFDSTVAHPAFTQQQITTSVTVSENEPFYLGTMSSPTPLGIANGGAPSETRLAFLHVSLPGPTAEELKAPAKPSDFSSVNVEYSWYSLDRAIAREILIGSSTLTGPWDKLQPLLKENKARLEHLMTLNTKSGQRSVVQESKQISFGSEYTPATSESRAASKNSPAKTERRPGYFSAVELQNLGVTVEIEPVIMPDGVTADLNYAVQNSTEVGSLQVTGAAAKLPIQPVVESRKIISSQSVLVGRKVLAGTFNPPGADGVNERKDTGRTWLLFIRVQGVQ